MTDPSDAVTVAPFKQCTCCPVKWQTRDDFLSDPEVELIGYQAHFEDLKAGLLLFNHACQTTMGIQVESFQDLHQGPIFEKRLKNDAACPGVCLRQGDLRLCPKRCECTYVREILQIVLKWKKRQAA
ncbi:MAG: hypothetical protein ACOYOU_00370 [Kiritimatiellia bacterium]